MCRTVQEKYNREFKDFQNPQREWTLRSIRAHAEEHGGMSSSARMLDLENTFFMVRQVHNKAQEQE